jgi:phosphate transport system permease protein
MTTSTVPMEPRMYGARQRETGARAVVRKALDFLTIASAYCGAGLVLASLIFLAGALLYHAWPAVHRFGFSFFTSQNWDPGSEEFGALSVIYGTLVSSLLAVLIAVPVSIGSAVFLIRLSPKWLAGPASFLIEVLAAIPSITFGLWGRLVLTPHLQEFQHWVQPHLKAALGPLKIGGYSLYEPFSGPAYGASILAAGIILAIMITPIITAVSRDVLRTVPKDLEQGAYALGATWWQATKVMLSYAKIGIFGAVILGLARAIGETMAVTMVIGNTNAIKLSIFAPGQTMASILANEFLEADKETYVQSLVYVALVLLIVTTLINTAARLLIWRVAKKGK